MDNVRTDSTLQLATAHLDLVRQEIGKVIVGQQPVVDGVLTCLLAGGHVLLEGVPGLGKTTLLRTLGRVLHLKYSRIQFTPDLMPADITGTNMLTDDPSGRKIFEFQRGPLFAHIVLADEINRATPKTQSALLEAMQEQSVTVGGKMHRLENPFMVLATQNPIEMEGTYPLPEAQLDRFLLKIVIGYPALDAELAMLSLHESGFDPERGGGARIVDAVLTAEEARDCRALVDRVHVAADVREYIASITRATRQDSSLVLGASPRASVALQRAARAAAVIAGRDFATPDDVKARTLSVLRHRVVLAPELEVEGRSTDDVLMAILSRVVAPT
jgi:MoxR-like ATPase